jgi:hypothetical protein
MGEHSGQTLFLVSKRINPVLLLLLLSGCVADSSNKALPEDLLPDPAQIASIQVIEYSPVGENEQGGYLIAPEYWKPILDALSPAKRDHSPAAWQVLGSLAIELKNGRSFHLSLYELSDSPPGAFSAGPTNKDRVYYRGGDSKRLREAMQAAYEATKQDIYNK